MVKSPRFQAVEMHIQPWHSHAEFLSAVPAGKLSDRATGAPAAGLGLGAASVQTESGPWSGFAPRGKRLLRAPDEGHARLRLAGNPGCTSSRSSHERFLLQLQVLPSPAC
ncbi:uncharacterized protein LOC106629329 isoform X4 [Zonotrichia albicollis]|uniref:uncharacterized protein LOC106629329 isoform X4 n=1 Tax=Zonotrichia albicollis TaxID=44394 RepID=UPI003D810F90